MEERQAVSLEARVRFPSIAPPHRSSAGLGVQLCAPGRVTPRDYLDRVMAYSSQRVLLDSDRDPQRRLRHPCGTPAAYFRHYRNGEKPCEACRLAQNEYRDELRAKRRSGETTPRPLSPCGTNAAYRRHVRRGEEPCEPCRNAARAEWARRSREPLAAPMDESKCGTPAGFAQHKRRGQPPCDPCRQARRDYENDRNRKKGIPARSRPACGTVGGYKKHLRIGQQPCEDCHEAKLEHQRAERGGQPFKAAECGTRSGYRRHSRLGEQACEPCLAAHRDHAKPRRYWRQLWENQEGVCALCDQPVPRDPASVHVDHIIPHAKEGPDTLDNLQVVHVACNRSKSDQDNEEARQMLLSRAA